MAARLLGGHSSDAVTGDAVLLDLLPVHDSLADPAFLVRRQPDTSHPGAMQRIRDKSGRDTAAAQFAGGDNDA
jgi:hypothetical protein